MSVKLLTEHHLEFLSLKGGYTGSSESTFIKITCRGSVISVISHWIIKYTENVDLQDFL